MLKKKSSSTSNNKLVELKLHFENHLETSIAKDPIDMTKNDVYKALALTIRDKMMKNWLKTQREYAQKDLKRVCYLSLEFLMGRLLENTLINLEIYDEAKELMHEYGLNLNEIIHEEPDMGLGNGGLGRLAACFLDSLSTLSMPAVGYGIRYEYGIFEQDIVKGFQIEKPDKWLRYGNPWEIVRPEYTYTVKFNGNVSTHFDVKGKMKHVWVNTDDVLAVAYDIPIPGYKNETVNTLRLWEAKSTDEFDFENFNQGNYLSAVEKKTLSETISKVLYPNDSFPSGKILRLKQQYFFVSATLQDIVRRFKRDHDSDWEKFSDKVAIQLNDTHPAIAIPDLMRILIDEENLEWENAWELTTKTFAYTNHTIVPEALEEWQLSIIDKMLPRHSQIIEEINRRLIDEARKNNFDENLINEKISIVHENQNRVVRMSNLSIYGSMSVNGVAELHSQIIREQIFADLYKLFPDKFNNKTNGISVRRFIRQANPLLSELISESIGDEWITDLQKIKTIEKFVNDSSFITRWQEIKLQNKMELIKIIKAENDLEINPYAMFDTQVKRFHEYKRQLLNILHVIHLYLNIKDEPQKIYVPRVVIFGGKAAPSYVMAKLVIKLIHSVAKIVNEDSQVNKWLQVVFIKNYGVSLAEIIIPATDLSEQISTAGFEASGTGNMKFALNGALTIGTLDGANIEIKNEVGDENIFIFGLRSDEIFSKRNTYNPFHIYEINPDLKRVIDCIKENIFSKSEPGIFEPILNELLYRDYYFLLEDFNSYKEAQLKAESVFLSREEWTKKSILNVAGMGKFSSDRTIKEYASEIWNIKSAH